MDFFFYYLNSSVDFSACSWSFKGAKPPFRLQCRGAWPTVVLPFSPVVAVSTPMLAHRGCVPQGEEWQARCRHCAQDERVVGPCRSDLRPPGGRLPAHPSTAALTGPAEVARRRQVVPLPGLGRLLPRWVGQSESCFSERCYGQLNGWLACSFVEETCWLLSPTTILFK